MPGMSGLEIQRQLRAANWRISFSLTGAVLRDDL
jgi:hypothetical protein